MWDVGEVEGDRDGEFVEGYSLSLVHGYPPLRLHGTICRSETMDWGRW